MYTYQHNHKLSESADKLNVCHNVSQYKTTSHSSLSNLIKAEPTTLFTILEDFIKASHGYTVHTVAANTLYCSCI